MSERLRTGKPAAECAQVQGFLFGAPMLASEFERRLLRPMPA